MSDADKINVKEIIAVLLRAGVDESEIMPFRASLAELKEIAKALDGPHWQRIESAPKDGTAIIVCDEDGLVGEARFVSEDAGWWWQNNDPTDAWGREIYPSQWMPLPNPPARAGE